MIKVRRLPAPSILTDNDGKGVEEIRYALEYYADPGRYQKEPEFKAYAHHTVKDALVKMFKGKCAYCESSVSGSHDGDIEHFRPKAAVKIEGRKALLRPGYYWLAAVWENLFLSCQHCNQTRRHRRDKGDVVRAGKANLFPVAREAERVRPEHVPPLSELTDENGDLDLSRVKAICKNEPAMLLDPCEDEPNDHLEFLSGMHEGTVRPKRSDPRGDHSIRVFGLHRPQLINDRKTALVLIKNSLNAVHRALKFVDRDPRDKDAKRNLRETLKALKAHCDPQQRFSGMARQIARRFIEEYTKPPAKLESKRK